MLCSAMSSCHSDREEGDRTNSEIALLYPVPKRWPINPSHAALHPRVPGVYSVLSKLYDLDVERLASYRSCSNLSAEGAGPSLNWSHWTSWRGPTVLYWMGQVDLLIGQDQSRRGRQVTYSHRSVVLKSQDPAGIGHDGD